jgi:AAA15 family ATPase/GTPase
MENRITNLKISNFKSIREAELECGRINLFVGRPNTGKSNLLEALSLLGASSQISKDEKFMGNYIRYEEISELFFWTDIKNEILIDSNIIVFKSNFPADENSFEFEIIDSVKSERKILCPLSVSPEGKVLNPNPANWDSPVKKYSFKESNPISDRKIGFLISPFGDNLVTVLLTTPKLKEEIPGLFDEYKLNFVVDHYNRTFEIQRKENGIFYKIPYKLTADTLQRIIFHYAAIFSNKDSVILFEEPESHSFPPYVSDLAYKISQDSENQYFITTHSPYLFTKIVEETPIEEVAVFITYFENFETKFKKLSVEDISELLNYGIDIFFNAKYFLDETVSENPS